MPRTGAKSKANYIYSSARVLEMTLSVERQIDQGYKIKVSHI